MLPVAEAWGVEGEWVPTVGNGAGEAERRYIRNNNKSSMSRLKAFETVRHNMHK